MCGLFGITGFNSRDPFHKAFWEALVKANSPRGTQALGVLSIGSGTMRVTKKLRDEGLYFEPGDDHTILGHFRQPTGGWSKSKDDVHPFQKGADRFLAHNGILINHESYPQHKLLSTSVDSGYILGAISHQLDNGYQPAAAIASTVTMFEGQQACWFYLFGRGLYLWRVMSPLYVYHREFMSAFSSIPIPGYDFWALEQGQVWRMSEYGFEHLLDFKFHSIYGKV